MLVAKYAEPVLKGRMARERMEGVLMRNVTRALESGGACGFSIKKERGVLFIEVKEEEKLAPLLGRVFGVEVVFKARKVDSDAEKIALACVEEAKRFPANSSFAVRARRAWKHGVTSQELAGFCGARILESLKRKKFKVNLSFPDNTVFVDFRRNFSLVWTASLRGPGGLPAGCEGKAVCVLRDSGASLLAAWMMAKRGMLPILFCADSFGKQKAVSCAKKLAGWLSGEKPKVFSARVPGVKGTLCFERALLASACALCERLEAQGVVSGEFLEEVSGEGVLGALDSGLSFPVFRPLSGLGAKRRKKFFLKAGLKPSRALKSFSFPLKGKQFKERPGKIVFSPVL